MASDLIVIAGGSGFVGKILSSELMKHGYSVNWISRSKKDGIHTITWDELKQNGLPVCMAVVNLCGCKIGDFGHKLDDKMKIEIYQSRVETTRELVKAIFKLNVKPKVYVGVSGIGYYAAIDAAVHTEQSQGGKHDWISKMTHDWEESSALLSTQDVRRVILRLGMILGKEGGGYKEMIKPFKLGLGGTMGSGQQPFPWIHVHDVVKMLLKSIEDNKMTGVYNGVAPEMITNGDFVHQLGSLLHKPTFMNIPEFVIRWTVGEEVAEMILHVPKVIPKHLQDQGFEFDFPDIQSALKDLVHVE